MLAVLCGILMASFYYFVKAAMPEAEPGISPHAGRQTHALHGDGPLLPGRAGQQSCLQHGDHDRPFTGPPVPLADYFRGSARDHLWGIVGGMVWAVGMTFSIVAFGVAGGAISYGLGQGATLVAALWGVFIWREFREAPQGTSPLIALMLAGYVSGWR